MDVSPSAEDGFPGMVSASRRMRSAVSAGQWIAALIQVKNHDVPEP
jgi:hypothetical protein